MRAEFVVGEARGLVRVEGFGASATAAQAARMAVAVGKRAARSRVRACLKNVVTVAGGGVEALAGELEDRVGGQRGDAAGLPRSGGRRSRSVEHNSSTPAVGGGVHGHGAGGRGRGRAGANVELAR